MRVIGDTKTSTIRRTKRIRFGKLGVAIVGLLIILGLGIAPTAISAETTPAQSPAQSPAYKVVSAGKMVDSAEATSITSTNQSTLEKVSIEQVQFFHGPLFYESGDLSWLDEDTIWASCSRDAYNDIYGVDASSSGFRITTVRTKTEVTKFINDGQRTAAITEELADDFTNQVQDCYWDNNDDRNWWGWWRRDRDNDDNRKSSGSASSTSDGKNRISNNTIGSTQEVRLLHFHSYEDLSWLDDEDSVWASCFSTAYDEVLGIDTSSSRLRITDIKTKTDTTVTITDGTNTVELTEDLADDLRDEVHDCYFDEFRDRWRSWWRNDSDDNDDGI